MGREPWDRIVVVFKIYNKKEHDQWKWLQWQPYLYGEYVSQLCHVRVRKSFYEYQSNLIKELLNLLVTYRNIWKPFGRRENADWGKLEYKNFEARGTYFVKKYIFN